MRSKWRVDTNGFLFYSASQPLTYLCVSTFPAASTGIEFRSRSVSRGEHKLIHRTHTDLWLFLHGGGAHPPQSHRDTRPSRAEINRINSRFIFRRSLFLCVTGATRGPSASILRLLFFQFTLTWKGPGNNISRNIIGINIRKHTISYSQPETPGGSRLVRLF